MMSLTGPHVALSSDINALAFCHTSSFSSAGPRTVYNLIFSGCSHEAMLKLEAEVLEKSFAPGSRSKIVFMRDDETGEIVSYAQWASPVSEGAEGEVKTNTTQVKNEAKPPEFPDGINFPLFRRMFLQAGASEAEKEAKMPVPEENCWKLHRVGTRPDYRGKGAARTLVKWGTDQADREGKCCVLSTDPEQPAFRSYIKAGFDVVGNVSEIELEPFGSKGILRYARMIRYPR